MTDYKNLKLIASSSPHIRSNESTRTIMMDVIIAMIPALIMSVFVFGFRALALTLVSVAACVFWEWGYRKLLKKPQSIGDLSAVVTGILLAFTLPPTASGGCRSSARFSPSWSSSSSTAASARTSSTRHLPAVRSCSRPTRCS